jgi:hypothetical protein
MRRIGRLVAVGASVVACAAVGSPASHAATGSLVVVSSGLPNEVSSPLVDDAHHRVFVITGSRLLAYHFDLTRAGKAWVGRSAEAFALPRNDAAVYAVHTGFGGVSGHLVRFDPQTLARTGVWAEPRVFGIGEMTFSRGLFWAVVERDSPTSGHSRVVLASLDPGHPARGWQTAPVAVPCADAEGCLLRASLARHWLAVVDAASSSDIAVYRLGADGSAQPVSEATTYEIGPAYSPDGRSALLVGAFQDSTGNWNPGFQIYRPSDLSSATVQRITSDYPVDAAYTPDGTSIITITNGGASDFYDAADPGAAPTPGSAITIDDKVIGVEVPATWWPAVSASRPFLFANVHEDLRSRGGGNHWSYRIARYPLP